MIVLPRRIVAGTPLGPIDAGQNFELAFMSLDEASATHCRHSGAA